MQLRAMRNPFTGEQAEADDVDALGAVVMLFAEATFFAETDLFVHVDNGSVAGQNFAAQLVQREFAEGGIECRELHLQPGASGCLGTRIEAPERGALGGVEVGEVDHALGGAGVVAVEVPAPARVLLQTLEPGAVFVEADLMVVIHGPAHGGGVAPGEDQLEVGCGEGL